ncbi:hypothetical protein Tco_0801939 [Tanacetum coccineum]|uniref:Uncharacterized protein n=1 Tax=Tanacetum coccineum TaxID=301880 RepID=A0ABQ5A097_9ASTR
MICWSADLKSETTKDISIRSFIEVLVLNHYVPVRKILFDTSAGNPVKEILLKLSLPDHRIFKDGGEAKVTNVEAFESTIISLSEIDHPSNGRRSPMQDTVSSLEARTDAYTLQGLHREEKRRISWSECKASRVT